MLLSPHGQKIDSQDPGAGPAEQVLSNGKAYTVNALKKANSEAGLEGSIAQNLFTRWFEEAISVNGDVAMPQVETAIDKCFRIAEKFRKKLHVWEFEKREQYDKDERARFQKDGKTILHLPDAGLVAPHVPGGYIPGMDP